MSQLKKKLSEENNNRAVFFPASEKGADVKIKGAAEMADNTVGTDINQVEITSLNHIKGQPQVQELLKVNIEAFFQNRSNNENSSFGPVLLLGPNRDMRKSLLS